MVVGVGRKINRAALALVAGLTSCVIPVGPQFDDPETNVAPQLVSSNIAPGSAVTGDPEFRVAVADDNLLDTLHVRWLIDYPPLTENSRTGENLVLPPPEAGSRERIIPPFRPNCVLNSIARGFTDHQLLLAVADRPFRAPEESNNTLDSVVEGGRVLYLSWTFALDCNTP